MGSDFFGSPCIFLVGSLHGDFLDEIFENTVLLFDSFAFQDFRKV